MEKEMRKINDTHNYKTSLEVRELKDELSDAQLNTVSGGRKAVSSTTSIEVNTAAVIAAVGCFVQSA
jgi:hypothetical protein